MQYAYAASRVQAKEAKISVASPEPNAGFVVRSPLGVHASSNGFQDSSMLAATAKAYVDVGAGEQKDGKQRMGAERESSVSGCSLRPICAGCKRDRAWIGISRSAKTREDNRGGKIDSTVLCCQLSSIGLHSFKAAQRVNAPKISIVISDLRPRTPAPAGASNAPPPRRFIERDVTTAPMNLIYLRVNLARRGQTEPRWDWPRF